jgi:hypothetical protein
MVNESINYFLRTPGSQVQSVYLMAWNYRDLDACRKALEGSERVTRA